MAGAKAIAVAFCVSIVIKTLVVETFDVDTSG